MGGWKCLMRAKGPAEVFDAIPELIVDLLDRRSVRIVSGKWSEQSPDDIAVYAIAFSDSRGNKFRADEVEVVGPTTCDGWCDALERLGPWSDRGFYHGLLEGLYARPNRMPTSEELADMGKIVHYAEDDLQSLKGGIDRVRTISAEMDALEECDREVCEELLELVFAEGFSPFDELGQAAPCATQSLGERQAPEAR